MEKKLDEHGDSSAATKCLMRIKTKLHPLSSLPPPPPFLHFFLFLLKHLLLLLLLRPLHCLLSLDYLKHLEP